MKKALLMLPLLGLFTINDAMAQSQKTSGLNLNNLDKNTNPAENFYQYSCGGWMQNNPLPNEYSRFGSFDKLAADNQEKLKNVVLEIAGKDNPKGSIGDKVATLYNIGMDTEKLEKQGAAPIIPELNAIAALEHRQAIADYIGTMHRNSTFSFFHLFGEADPTNSTMRIAWTYQGGLGMGEREYYFAEGKDAENLRKQYMKLIEKQFKNAKADKIFKRKAGDMAVAVFELEKQLAEKSLKPEELRDPLAQINIKDVKELGKLINPINIDQYLRVLGLDIKTINIPQEQFMKQVGHILSNAKEEDLKAYLAWNVINEAAAYLSSNFEQANFDFYGTAMSGTKEMKPRWKRVLGTVNGSLGEAVGEVYVDKYFPKEAKAHMEQLVKNLQVALASRITKLDWMSSETKLKALEKLTTFHVKVGYPDKWKDYSDLEIRNDSYYANVSRAGQFAMKDMLGKIGKPVDKNEWLMTPQTVNAYYNPTTNEICFPAAILQPPFFDMNADDAMNYGAIGVVIGHEMTHGFDDQGRLYDKDGNVNNWWTEQDAENFKKRANILVDHFNNIEVAAGVNANGKLTLGENIADNGGIQVSYEAMQMARKNDNSISDFKDGFSVDQRFFLAYSAVWAGNIRPQEVLRLTNEDPHSLGKWRVNGTLPHIEQFLNAFNIKQGDKMWLDPDKRAIIW